MKKNLTILMLMLILLLTACVNDEEAAQSGIELSELRESMKVEDFTDLGVWLLELDAAVLQERLGCEKVYMLEITGQSFTLQLNPLNKEQYVALIPDGVGRAAIESGVILPEMGRGQFKREAAGVVIASVYLLKDGLYYEITLSDYLWMKAADNDFVYENGTLIRPTHVKSSDGYAYTMKRYYDARQASSEHTVSSAFVFLEGREDHLTQLVFTTNPYRAKIVNDSVQTFQPDTRDRVWQLGEMGTIDESSAFTYDIIDDSNAQTLTLKLKESNLPEKYSQTHAYEIQFNDDATICVLHEGDPGIFEGIIQYATTSNVDLVKNARFEEKQVNPFTLITSQSNTGYDTFDDAFNAIGDEEIATITTSESTTVTVTEAILINNGKDIRIKPAEGVTITFKGDGGDHRIFYVNGETNGASLTLYNTVVRDGSGEGRGAGLYATDACLYLEDCQVVYNRTTDHGAGLFVQNSTALLRNTLIASNTTHQRGGGMFIFDSSHATITDSTVCYNMANDHGGGINVVASTVFITDTLIATNTANVYGGGVYLHSGTTSLENCYIENNHSENLGGGIYLYGGIAALENCMIENNYAKSNGGGINIGHIGAILYFNSGHIHSNKADGYGGGICRSNGDVYTGEEGLWADTPNEYNGDFSVNTSGQIYYNLENPAQVYDNESTSGGNQMKWF